MTLSPLVGGLRSGLIWGYDLTAGGATGLDRTDLDLPLTRAAEADLRWLHVNLTDQWTRRWFAEAGSLPTAVRDLLLSTDRHQRALIDNGTVACIIHDFEREFDSDVVGGVGSLTFLIQPGLIVTARLHPIRAADVVRDRIRASSRPLTTAAALDMLMTAIAEVNHRIAVDLTAVVQAAEDALLDEGQQPDARTLVKVRKQAIQLHRQMAGLTDVLHRLEADEELPIELEPSVVKHAQRMASLDADVAGIQANLRLLREELEIQTASRTSQNLYLLSILSALLLPATLVTGIFGMNTGGLPWTGSPSGSAVAVGLVVASSALVYLWLRARGFFSR
ncbi:CorA family divalent cation transporter [Glacieibacterium sp.]|uniref:CorA family divalent cation transporter n=1 Tax=Glacieibacterium sp. TaxID=2860237 RepID=UPI003AFFC873